MVIERNLGPVVLESAQHYPVVTVTGPRQSGKTTLARALFPSYAYVTLEPLDHRERARSDPRGLLEDLGDAAIIDEVQLVPELLGYIQEAVDADPTPGRYVLTGSQHFGLTDAVAQSLAGRSAVLGLMSPSYDELLRFADPPTSLMEVLFTGAYPRIHDRGVPAGRWLQDYITTYVQRDVRQVLEVGDLERFTQLVRLAAGSTANELNLSRLGGDAGVSHNTVRSWLSVLANSYLCVEAPAWHRNLRKQLVKAPKLHFLDSGLVCALLGIRSADELRHHPLRGAIFESWVFSEIAKQWWHRGREPRLFHFRQTRGPEIDVVVETGSHLFLVEAKSSATVSGSFLRPIYQTTELVEASSEWRTPMGRLIYGGRESQTREGIDVLPWSEIASVDWT